MISPENHSEPDIGGLFREKLTKVEETGTCCKPVFSFVLHRQITYAGVEHVFYPCIDGKPDYFVSIYPDLTAELCLVGSDESYVAINLKIIEEQHQYLGISYMDRSTELISIKARTEDGKEGIIYKRQWEEAREHFADADFDLESMLGFFTCETNETREVKHCMVDEDILAAVGYSMDTYSYDMRVTQKDVIDSIIREFAVNAASHLYDEYTRKNYPPEIQEYAYRINSELSEFTVDCDTLSMVVTELSPWLDAAKKGDYSQPVPNLAFLGEPGTGKSTIADLVSEKILGAVTLKITGSDLMGQYVGQTKPTVIAMFRQLLNTAKERKVPAGTPKILIVDEAYELLNSQDNGTGYAAEAVETLLQVMGKKPVLLINNTIDSKRGNDVQVLLRTEGHDSSQIVWEGARIKEPEDKGVELDNSVAVWLLGYEKEMRKGLSENKGLYRRVSPITLKKPTQKELTEHFSHTFVRNMNMLDSSVLGDSREVVLEECAQLIADYFKWARSKTYAEFFGNYAGAEALAREISKTITFKKAPITKHDITGIINRLKQEIRVQYKTVIALKMPRSPFMVYTEIDETLKDYIGGRSAKDKLSKVIDMICSGESFPGCERPKGAILCGPPGTGKTYLARCMAGELMSKLRKSSMDLDVAFISTAATEIASPDMVKLLFAETDGYDNVIIFIDEIDAIGRKRETLPNPAILIQLMSELDGFDSRKNIFIIAATNAPELLDNALTRPGRFDMTLEVTNPDKQTRAELINEYTKVFGYSAETKEKLTDLLAGMSPIEIKTILNEARILYFDCQTRLSKLRPDSETQPWFAHRVLRNGADAEGAKVIEIKDARVLTARSRRNFNEKLYLKDIREVIAQRFIGERNRTDSASDGFSLEKNNESLSSTAVHEVGHALMNLLRGEKFEKITILSRGTALGYVEPDQNAYGVTKKNFNDRIDVLLGGRAAEEVIYGKNNISGGAVSDIGKASHLARKMIMIYGMSESIGPIALVDIRGSYLGSEWKHICSDALYAEAEAEVQALLKERYNTTLELLYKYRGAIEKLAETVYTAEEMSGREFAEAAGEVTGENFSSLWKEKDEKD